MSLTSLEGRRTLRLAPKKRWNCGDRRARFLTLFLLRYAHLYSPGPSPPSPGRGFKLLRAFGFDVGSSIFFRSDPGVPENAVQGVNPAVLGPVLFNDLSEAVVPAAHGRMVRGFGEWHDGTLVYHYRVHLHNQGAPVNDREQLPDRRMPEGYEVLEEVSDPGQRGASLERPGMDRVRDLVALGGVSVVLAQDRDRFAREPAYHYLLRREFEEYGCKIRALNDRGDDSPEGELTDGILDQLAKFERAKMTERSRRGKLRKAREGKVIAGRMASYGRAAFGFRYNDSRDSLLLDEERILVVKRMFYMAGVEGRPVYAIKRALDVDGV